MTPTTVNEDTITGIEHPRYHEQVELERQMLELGKESFRITVEKAKAKGHLSNLRPLRKLMLDWMPAVVKGVKEWRRVAQAQRGVKPIALGYIQEADAELLSLVALRCTLDGIDTKHSRLIYAANRIGMSIEHELRIRAWEKADKVSFKRAERYLHGEGSDATHRAKVMIALFQRQDMAASYPVWSKDVRWRVGATMLDILVRHTGWFSIAEDPDIAPRKNNSSPLILLAKPLLLEWLVGKLDAEEVLHPAFVPMVIPPRPWTNIRDGGYWTPYVETPRLIAFKAHQELQRANAADEYDALDMPRVYSAVNHLQATSWAINRPLLDHAERSWDIDMQIGKLPPRSIPPEPSKPEGWSAGDLLPKKYRDAKRGWYRQVKSLGSQIKRTSTILRVSSYLRDQPEIFFPHKLDFRGRTYSIPGGLSPQGDDLALGQLTFAEGMPITKRNNGARWLALQVANTMGYDKASINDRVKWVHEMHDGWRAIAKDPIGEHHEWSTGSKPWQSLAAILEWNAYLEKGEGFRSTLPIIQDGTCNGLQHLIAITRDEKSASLVNLTPGETPSDIYKVAASKLEARLRAIEELGGDEGQLAGAFLTWCGSSIPRTATKRPVMVLPYGGTRDAFSTYLKEWLDEVHPFAYYESTEQSRTFRYAALRLATNELWAIVNGMLPGAMAVMAWLRDCAKLCAQANQPIFWTAPCSGFVVRHFYGLQIARTVEMKLDGRRYQVKAYEPTKDLDVMAQCQGIAPNFIHSLDAAALNLTLNKARAAGINHVTAIHDAYGAHAANMDKLSVLLREAFIAVHETDVLGMFWDRCEDVLTTLYHSRGGIFEGQARKLARKQMPQRPAMGCLDINAIRESAYFFS